VELRERGSGLEGEGGTEGRGWNEEAKNHNLRSFVFFFQIDSLLLSFFFFSLYLSLHTSNARLRPSAAGHRRGLPVRRLR